MEVKSIKDVLNVIDYAVVDNNAKFFGASNLEDIRIYLLDKGQEDIVSLWTFF